MRRPTPVWLRGFTGGFLRCLVLLLLALALFLLFLLALLRLGNLFRFLAGLSQLLLGVGPALGIALVGAAFGGVVGASGSHRTKLAGRAIP